MAKVKGNPLSRADALIARLALDWTYENRPEVIEIVAAEKAANDGACSMAYLRRVPPSFVGYLLSCPEIDKAIVTWQFRVNYGGRHGPLQLIQHPCFPRVILDGMMEFLKPAGTQHVAPIGVLLTPGSEVGLIGQKDGGP